MAKVYSMGLVRVGTSGYLGMLPISQASGLGCRGCMGMPVKAGTGLGDRGRVGFGLSSCAVPLNCAMGCQPFRDNLARKPWDASG
jgi:hypothetical protein